MVVDTDQASLSSTAAVVRQVCPLDQILTFDNPMLAVKCGVNEPVDLIVTEISMRGVDGVTLARLVRTYQPAVRILFLSSTGQPGEIPQSGADGWLSKPVTAQALRESIPRRALPENV